MAYISKITDINGNEFRLKDTEAVRKSGDTMTGNLDIERAAVADESIGFGTLAGQNSNYKSINQSDWGVMYYALPVINVSDGTLRPARFRFFEYSPNSDGTRTAYAEMYSLPAVDVGRTSSIDYYILTSKNAVRIDQGGTGANTASSGRINLNASAGIMLLGTDDTVAKIRQKLETIGQGETATVYVSRVPLNLITGRTADQYYLSGTVNRVNVDDFVFDLVDVVTLSFRWSFRATITSTSASCGTIYKYTGTALT